MGLSGDDPHSSKETLSAVLCHQGKCSIGAAHSLAGHTKFSRTEGGGMMGGGIFPLHPSPCPLLHMKCSYGLRDYTDYHVRNIKNVNPL